MTVNIGPVLLHSVERGGWTIDLQTRRGANQSRGADWGVIVVPDGGGGVDPVVLTTAGSLDLGVNAVDVSSNVLSHVLGGGATVDEGIDNGGEDAEGVEGVFGGVEV